MRLGEVQTFERVQEDGAEVALLKVDTGGDTVTVYHNGDAGDDSQPLKGDTVVLDESEENVVSYSDHRNAGLSGPGEKRIYARRSDGTAVAQIHLHSDGSVMVSNDNGSVELAANGNVTILPNAELRVGANAQSAVALAQATDDRISALENALAQFINTVFNPHIHPDALGTTGPTPAPGTPPTPGNTTASQMTFSE